MDYITAIEDLISELQYACECIENEDPIEALDQLETQSGVIPSLIDIMRKDLEDPR